MILIDIIGISADHGDMSASRFVVIVGNPRPASRTLTVAGAAASTVTRAAGLPDHHLTIDLCVLARHLLLPEPSPAVEEALDQVTGADLLLVVSPTYKGSYTGLLKVFLDRVPHRALDRAVALPLMLMGVAEHAPAVDAYLRPLLVELGATVPVPGLAVLESDLDRLDSVLGPWADQVAGALAGYPAPTHLPGPPHAATVSAAG
jgi:FMN reductase